MPKNNRKARSVHNILLPLWIKSYRYIYEMCTGPDKPSVSYTLNEIVRQWIETDKQKKGLEK
jgi:hypothetical protein